MSFIISENCEKLENVVYLPKEKYRTLEHLSVHEVAKAVGIRATQIEYGDSDIYTDYEGLDDSVLIAMKELLDGKSPLILHRAIEYNGITYIEEWKVREMVIPAYLSDYDVYKKYRDN